MLKEQGREKQKESGKQYGERHSKEEVLSKADKTSHDTQKDKPSVLSKTDKTEPSHNTQKEVAEDLGWSTGKVASSLKLSTHFVNHNDNRSTGQ